MRTTVDIDKELLEEALKLSKAGTKKELIHLSLKEYIRKIKIKNLKKKLGNYNLAIDLEDLEKGRADEEYK